ncbi:unnamed protein product [Porites evermanni]|uniref:Uncharacterized protein n=1 Tax=Porites evermanni TaxID=104178 RepID=A0ABN8PXB9_9CNID|nr:unnamed protein product [Porites evermanni]
MRPEFKGNLTQSAIHQLYMKSKKPGIEKEETAEGKRWITQSKKHQERNLFQLWSKACTSKKSMACYAKCGKKGHFVCKSKRGGNVNDFRANYRYWKYITQPVDAPSNEDSAAEDYT